MITLVRSTDSIPKCEDAVLCCDGSEKTRGPGERRVNTCCCPGRSTAEASLGVTSLCTTGRAPWGGNGIRGVTAAGGWNGNRVGISGFMFSLCATAGA